MDYMQRALDLACEALGRTSPNPAVGAVIVRRGEVVGEGFTQPPGSAHAEIVALAQAGQRADGAELYVTLEPCCHYGRTPPCTDAILEAGIRVVHIATVDPFPAVNGGGIEVLRRAGLEVRVGEREAAATKLNEAFFHFVRTRRPFVTAKWAMTLDGKIASRTGDARWITGDAARHVVHQERDASDAIIVGVGTAVVDDPKLTVRLDAGSQRSAPRSAPPLRVVFDSTARIPVESHLIATSHEQPTLVFVTSRASTERIECLRAAGAEVIAVPDSGGRVNPGVALERLAERGIVRVLLEGGGELFAAFFEAGLIDRVMAFVAPKVIGGRAAPTPIGGSGQNLMADATGLRDVVIRSFDADILIEGYPGLQRDPPRRVLIEAVNESS